MEIKKNMTLAAAFRYRGKLKKLMSSMAGIVANNPIAVEVDEVDLRNEAFETKSLDGDIELLIRLHGLMETVTTAVDVANDGAHALINSINRCKDTIKLLADIRSRIVTTPLVKNEYDYEASKHQKIELVPLYTKKWADELKAVKREMNTIEETLNEYNAKAMVSFSVDEELDLLVESA